MYHRIVPKLFDRRDTTNQLITCRSRGWQAQIGCCCCTVTHPFSLSHALTRLNRGSRTTSWRCRKLDGIICVLLKMARAVVCVRCCSGVDPRLINRIRTTLITTTILLV